MPRLNEAEKVGLRENETRKLIAVYPHKPEGSDAEIEDKVKNWFYRQSCAAEEQLRNCFVDAVAKEEVK
jgi:hypothetical protein